MNQGARSSMLQFTKCKMGKHQEVGLLGGWWSDHKEPWECDQRLGVLWTMRIPSGTLDQNFSLTMYYYKLRQVDNVLKTKFMLYNTFPSNNYQRTCILSIELDSSAQFCPHRRCTPKPLGLHVAYAIPHTKLYCQFTYTTYPLQAT